MVQETFPASSQLFYNLPRRILLCQRLRWIYDERSPDSPSVVSVHESSYGCLVRLYQRRSITWCLGSFPGVAWSNNQSAVKTIGIGYFWLLFGVGFQTGATDRAMFVLGRLLLGGATAFYSTSAPLLMTETAYPTHRGILTCVYNTGW